jgi:hypothetical protein
MSFLASIKQAKKGMPRAGNNLLRAKEEETVIKLTSEPKSTGRGNFLINWADAELYPNKVETGITLSIMKRQLVRTVHELFREASYTSVREQKPSSLPPQQTTSITAPTQVQ